MPNTATASPMRTWPSRTAPSAKSVGSRHAAACHGTPSGSTRTRSAGHTCSSRNPLCANTRSPGCTDVTADPASTTTPVHMFPSRVG